MNRFQCANCITQGLADAASQKYAQKQKRSTVQLYGRPRKATRKLSPSAGPVFRVLVHSTEAAGNQPTAAKAKQTVDLKKRTDWNIALIVTRATIY